MNQQFMKEKKIVPLVLQMSVPMILSMAVNALYNIVDSFFVAKISQNAMTALSEYSCGSKSRIRKYGNRSSGTRKSFFCA